MESLLSYVENSEEIYIDINEKSKMLKGYCKNLLSVHFGDGKKLVFCCSDCVWFDDGKKQDCLKCGVNVMVCSCYEFSSDVKHTSDKLNMQYVEGISKKREEDLFERENGYKSGFYSSDLHLISQNKNLHFKLFGFSQHELFNWLWDIFCSKGIL